MDSKPAPVPAYVNSPRAKKRAAIRKEISRTVIMRDTKPSAREWFDRRRNGGLPGQ